MYEPVSGTRHMSDRESKEKILGKMKLRVTSSPLKSAPLDFRA